MKFAKFSFALVSLNVALLVIIVCQQVRLRRLRDSISTPQPNPTAVSVTHSSGSSSEQTAAIPRDNITTPISPNSSSQTSGTNSVATSNETKPRFDWRNVESDDYRTYVKNLRAIGCPDQTVHDIVAADVLQAFAARRNEAMAERFRDFEFWKSDADETAAREALEKNRREVDDAMAGALRELLGSDTLPPETSAEWRQAALEQQLGFLPDDKRQQTVSLLQQFAETDALIRELAWDHRVPENADERLRVLADYDRKRAALREVLSPEEYDTVDMTVSWTANNLRQAMAKFHPTEDEFRMIFHEWRKQDENLATIFAKGEPDPGNEHVFAAIEKQLTPERYKLYRETWWK